MVSEVLFSSSTHCYGCDTITSIDSGKSHWYNNLNEFGVIISRLCKRCYDRYIYHKSEKYRSIKHLGQKRRIKFLNNRIIIKSNPRTGYCSNCKNNIFDKSCKKTHIHHILYDEINPLNNIIELCPSCHIKESWRLGQIGK